MNKKGEVNWVLVSLVLGVIVLVVLALGFTIGWSRFLPFIKSNNVENIKSVCSIACSTSNQYDYCSAPRTLKADDLPPGTDGKVPKSVAGNCNFFATNGDYSPKYGIEECSTITCP